MKRALPFLMLAVAAVTVAAVAQEVTIRRVIAPNSSEVYAMEMQSKQSFELPGGGAQEMTVTSGMTYTFNYGERAADGTMPLKLTMSNFKMQMDGPMAGMMPQEQMPKELVQEGKADANGRIVLSPPKNMSPAFAMMSSATSLSGVGLFADLPAKPVKLGDTWEVIVPKNPMLSEKDQVLQGKLLGEATVDGRPVWRIGLTGTLNTTMDLGKAMQGNPNAPTGGMAMVMKGEMGMNGEGLVDKETGQTLQMTTKMTSKANLELTDMGMTIPITGETTVKVTRK